MLRGIFSGGLVGLVVGGASLTVASLATEQPAGNTPPAPPQVTAPVAAEAGIEQTQAPQEVAAQSETVPVEPNAAPRVSAPQVEVTQPQMDTSSADVPAAVVLSETLASPEEAQNPPELMADAEEPVLPNPQSMAPQVPVNEQDLSVSTTPAAPLEAEPEAVVAVIEEMPAEVPTVDIPVPAPLPIAQEAPSAAPSAPAVLTLPTASAMPSGDETIKVNRVVTATPQEAPAAPEADTVPDDAPAIVRYAAAFENPEDKPLMSIILLDDGIMKGADSALKTLPFPVTVVLDPSTPDVGAKMAAYRAAGIEVGVRSALPAGASASYVQIAFEASFGTLNETVLLFDAGTGGMQNDRAVTEQAMSILAKDGRGLVSVSSGLNSAMREADKAGVAAGIIFRDLDGQGQDARNIRRFMDQAAFRARQESGVILLARIRPDTISALQLWGTANRAGQVALAPASAILTLEK